MKDDVHVLPINDIKEHSESRHCSCLPDIEVQDDGNALVIHHSYDGRELEEGGETAGRYEQVLDVREIISGEPPKIKKIKRKIPKITFVCNKCHREQEPNLGKSNGNWTVYDNKDCSCGGKFEMEIKQ